MKKSFVSFLAILSTLAIILVLSQFGYYPTWTVTFHGLHQLWTDILHGSAAADFSGLSFASLYYSLRLIVAAMVFTFAGAVVLTVLPLQIKWKPLAAIVEFLVVLLESVPDTIYIILTVAVVVYLLEQFNINLPAFNTLSPTWNDTWIPAVALALPGSFYLSRILTLQLQDEQRAAYVDTARAKGAGTGRIFYRHVLPNLNATLIRQIPVVATIILSTILFAEFFLEYKGQMFEFSEAVGLNTNSGMTTNPYRAGTIFIIGAVLVVLWWGFHFISERIHAALYPSGIVATSVYSEHRVQWRWILLGSVMLLIVIVPGLFPHLLTPFTPEHKDTGPLNVMGPPFAPLMPSRLHPFGTDVFGHDVLAQTVYGTMQTLWPPLVITIGVVLGSLILAGLAVVTSSKALIRVLEYMSQTLSAAPAFFVLFLVLYHRIDVTWLQIVQYISWFVLFEVGRGSYTFYQTLSQWYGFVFIEGAVSVGQSRLGILLTHLRSWLSRYVLQYSFSEFVRVLSLMAQLAALHVYLTITIGFLPFRPFTGMSWPHGIISQFPNWLGMIGDATLGMTYLSYPLFLAAPLLTLSLTLVGANLIAKGIRGTQERR